MSMPGTFTRDFVISIKPSYASKIMDGTKTVELRRRFPDTIMRGAIAVIYSSSPVQAIVGCVCIKEVRRLCVRDIWRNYRHAACIDRNEFERYFAGVEQGYAIVLERVRKLRQQIEVSDLQKNFGFVPPQSFRYLGEEYYSLFQDERF